MAISRNDYKYIHNTLGKKQTSIADDGKLKLGAGIKNLLTPLDSNHLYNPVFSNFYPTIENFQFKTWYPDCSTVYATKQGDYTKQSVKLAWDEEGRNGVYALESWLPLQNARDQYFFTSTSKNVTSYEKVMRKIGIGTIQPAYRRSYNYALYTENINEDVTYSLYKKNTVKSINADSTIKYGILKNTIQLKPNTSYVLQVVNACKPESSPKNTIKNIYDGQGWEFDEYLFFKTSKKSNQTMELSIAGLSFSHVVYHKVDDKIIQLRNYGHHQQAKVYLFESDFPWVVNDKGAVVGAMDTILHTDINDENSAFVCSMSNDEIYQAISKNAPKIDVTNSGLNVSLNITNAQDKILLDATLKEKKDPFTFHLFAARDYLINSPRMWNGIHRSTRYGTYRTFQQTVFNSDQEGALAFRVKPITLSGNSVDSITTTLTMDDIDLGALLVDDKDVIRAKEGVPISLSIMSLAGKNYTYSNSTFIQSNEGDKYTSFVLFWGKYDGQKIITCSPYSTTIIIERRPAILTTKETPVDSTDSGSDPFELHGVVKNNDTWNYSTPEIRDYYPAKEAIYITKVTQE